MQTMRWQLLTFFFCIFVYFASTAQAATLYFEPSTTTIAQGETAILTLRLDTDAEQCINVVDGVVTLDPGLRIVDVSIGNSIFNLWVEQPQVNEEGNQLTFAGGITNGYCGRIEGDPVLTNSILNVIVRAPSFSVGSGGLSPGRTVRFEPETGAYRNDGLGTRADVVTVPVTLTVTDGFGGQNDVWQDEVREDIFPPKPFSITLVQNQNAYQGKYYIVFNTTDKETGIDHYQVMEEPIEQFELFRWGAADAPWVRATSPYVLKDQTLRSTIRVKAIDKAGNEYIATLVPDPTLRGEEGVSPVLIFVLVLALTALGTVIAIFCIVRARRRRSAADGEVTSELEDGFEEEELDEEDFYEDEPNDDLPENDNENHEQHS
jgi:hypothetical protein